jgi:glutamine amidotransferase
MMKQRPSVARVPLPDLFTAKGRWDHTASYRPGGDPSGGQQIRVETHPPDTEVEKAMIDILNYRAGNAPSVSNALQSLGVACKLVSTPEEVERSARLILPGVGSARATLASLRETDSLDILRYKVMDERIPFLGICIGLQILFQHSEEEDTECLGWIKGEVKRFPNTDEPVPQIGWNEVQFGRQHHFSLPSASSGHFYFVNSYYAVPEDPNLVLAKSTYGHVDFCSCLAYQNIVATQFHVEKSGPLGLKLLKCFQSWQPN